MPTPTGPLASLLAALNNSAAQIAAVLNEEGSPGAAVSLQMPAAAQVLGIDPMPTPLFPYLAGVQQGGRVLVIQFASHPGSTAETVKAAIATAIPDVAAFARKLAAFDLTGTAPIP